jgi:hypothetical protein
MLMLAPSIRSVLRRSVGGTRRRRPQRPHHRLPGPAGPLPVSTPDRHANLRDFRPEQETSSVHRPVHARGADTKHASLHARLAPVRRPGARPLRHPGDHGHRPDVGHPRRPHSSRPEGLRAGVRIRIGHGARLSVRPAERRLVGHRLRHARRMDGPRRRKKWRHGLRQTRLRLGASALGHRAGGGRADGMLRGDRCGRPAPRS